MLRNPQTAQKGFSLIELMVAMLISLFALAAIISLLTNNLAYGRSSIDMLKLNQEMRTAMDIISDDLRRAGYWNNTQSMLGNSTVSNPYSFPTLPVTINTAADCITFSYDRDNTSNTPAANEIFGFALSNNAIVTGFPDDTINGCDDISSWNTVSNPNSIRITSLSFQIINPTVTTGSNAHQFTSDGGLVCVREIRIRIAANLVKDTTVKQSLEKTIRLRNDEIRRAPATSCA
ncbi:PilW family protein [Chitinibacter sp. S2-10]|uniref:PilW family protein n=1 Tax=Chitinibacter sp. S2-10 TaxID=3373597 RepID=UPI0039779637